MRCEVLDLAEARITKGTDAIHEGRIALLDDEELLRHFAREALNNTAVCVCVKATALFLTPPLSQAEPCQRLPRLESAPQLPFPAWRCTRRDQSTYLVSIYVQNNENHKIHKRVHI